LNAGSEIAAGPRKEADPRFSDSGESPGFVTTGDRSQPPVTSPGTVSDAELAAAVVAAVAEKRWAIAEVLAAEVQRRQRERMPDNVVPIDNGRQRRT
jgi:hypothetical protein